VLKQAAENFKLDMIKQAAGNFKLDVLKQTAANFKLDVLKLSSAFSFMELSNEPLQLQCKIWYRNKL
jgi:hypothetical protein